MSLFVISVLIGLLPAWRGGVVSLLISAWALAATLAAALVISPGELLATVLALAIVVLGFNAGIGAGLGLKLVAAARAAA